MATEVERKVRQLDNDVQSIYEILSRLEGTQDKLVATQRRHGNRLDEIAADQTAQREKLDQIGGQLGEVLELLRRQNG